MKKPILIPVVNQGFEINYLNPKNQSNDWHKKFNNSAEMFSQLESLFQLHMHDVLEILIFLEGECEFFCEGKTYHLKRGDVVVIPPYAVHRAIVKDIDSYERIIVSISEDLMEDFISSSPALQENIILQKTQGSYVLHLHSQNFEDAISLVDEIVNQMNSGQKAYSFALHYQLFQMLQVIYNPEISKPNFSKKDELDNRFVSVLDYIETYLTDPELSLDKVSNHFHLNKYYFSHYFKKNMNLPFYRYVSLKRLSFAVTMIKQNQISMEKIALDCGFHDYSSFYRLFKKEYNLSPKKFQREYKGLY
ncbi:AraC family transcriptional regulator [Oceanobacillus zhaokaii]|uniref:AraC family transcriptional regulator n=1 Tax=Oceanobacillus zhaokaii TaxID=2052660 RepID=A0A345PDN3_9BACI|nr:AraC family transcriptional regulator [Oceanobacillus zhaokaii]AXI08113.1 AraC family transcriptional regulator [Oceanobacillus zhaokaii]